MYNLKNKRIPKSRGKVSKHTLHDHCSKVTAKESCSNPTAGSSYLFSLTPEGKLCDDIGGLTLTCTKVNECIRYSSIRERIEEIGEIYFTTCNNLFHVRTGTIVAVAKSFVKTEEAVPKSKWSLACFLQQDYNGTSIAPIVGVRYCHVTKQYKFTVDNAPISLSIDEPLKMMYLNLVNSDLIALDGTIKVSTQSPSNVHRHRVMSLRKKLRDSSFHESSDNPLDENKASGLSFPTISNPGGLLSLMENSHPKPRSSLAKKGCSVVLIEGPVSALSAYEGRKEFLVPLALPYQYHSPKPEVHDYYLLPDTRTYKSEICSNPGTSTSVDRFNKKLAECAMWNKISLLTYDLSNYPNGLMFVFKENNDLSECSVKNEYITQSAMEHSEVDGIVLSHWTVDERYAELSSDDIRLARKVFGEKGFGNRKSSLCIGLNAYTGRRGNNQAIGDPFTPVEDVRESHFYRKHFDFTYAPFFFRIINSLTKQSSTVMSSSHRLLDRFYQKVWQEICKEEGLDFSECQLSSFRRFCNLSIFTGPNVAGRCDGFFNTIHRDKNDLFRRVFQRAANKFLDDIEQSNSELPDNVLRDIAYLRKLSKICGGFSVPTVCGYSIVSENSYSNLQRSDIQVHFANVGLGVSVRVSRKCYHYFMGYGYSHCTPAPVTVNYRNMVRTFSGGDTGVVGWGASNSVADIAARAARNAYLNEQRYGI